MMRFLERRGPDSGGLHCFPATNNTVVFGHRRLAILDLSPAGHQPMLTPDEKIGVVFNGCIYNFLELRHELEQSGYAFRSRCDTEVLLAGYRHWGIDELCKRSRGMFAFAIWDQDLQTLFLVRDRLGVKPLLYAERNGKLAFASTMASLQASGLVGGVDPAGVMEFLEFGWCSEDTAIYEGVRKVPPASILEWREGRLSQRCYWTLPSSAQAGPTFDEAVEQTEQLIVEAVRRRLIADVPVAALLSAGTDSTLICWALNKLGANVQTFTVGTPGDPANEVEGASQTARKLGIPHEVIDLNQDDQPDLDDLISAYTEPFACSSALGMLRVCKAVKPKATVLLTGDGGDDIFFGYKHHLSFLKAERLAARIPEPLANAWNALGWRPSSPHALKRAANLLHYATGGLGAATATHDGLPYYENHQMLGQRLDGLQIASRKIPPSAASARRLLADFHNYELKTRFVSEYMTKVDGASMFYSIEARAPLFDQDLWTYATSVPQETRLRGEELKAILRAVVRRNLGSEIADRPKRGFTIPAERWLLTRWRSQLDALRSGSALEREGWIRKGSLGPAIDLAIQREQPALQLWYLVVLEKWLQRSASAN
jgi:asparagine synthase (glutamine-hydrolysing)